MDKIYIDAKDKYVAAVVVYADGSNNLFYDEAGSVPVPAEDCLELFVKGVICKKGANVYRALSCSNEGVINFGLS